MSQIDLPPSKAPEWRRWKTGLFGSITNTFITIAALIVLLWLSAPILRWLIEDAVWHGDAQACAQETAGACWTFIGAKMRFILFGFFPPDLQWRPALCVALIVALLVFSALPRFWTVKLFPLWMAALGGCWALMAGTLTLPRVSTNQWGGLPITLTVAIAGLAFAFPVALLLALARQSNMGLLRILAVGFIEVLRGIPMIAVLYIAMLIIPMAVPGGGLIDKLLRAQFGITLFFSAYLAEVIRAGLQVVPQGQTEAAAALGMRYWQIVRLIALPQALRAVIPAIVNLSIGILLNTSLLAVIGIFDLLNTAKTAATDPLWLGFYTESYVFTALIYFLICFSGSRYSLWLERHLGASQKH
jgi:general L-amino acid transport system permease protein